ncbi:MAG: cyclomaltodextrinase N-terminal domain-containing protein [Xanthomonadales bacterium]|nr:cyclomaltodextrinase N-terminal domain-containing protein [Xanthomonadales bacterium]
MRLCWWLVWCVLLAGGSSAMVAAEGPTEPRVDPPHWWVGMQDPTLELLFSAPGVAGLHPRLKDERVQLLATTRLSSPNYLFVQLRVAPTAAAGPVHIELFDGSGAVQHQLDYPLKARQPGSRQRRGFGPADVIYLVVPDRFANGDPDNDSVGTLREAANRSEPGGRHGGDLAGMTAALDYLADLGITQIWSTPLVENDQPSYSYHGYAATDLYRIDPRFGELADYRQFVAAAAERGIGVIQDIVLNHIGSEHPWARDPPSPDWINHGNHFQPTQHARTTLQDPYAAAIDRREFNDGWFVATMPDLNQRQPQLATWLIQNSLWWIEEAGLSGIREDTYPYADPDFLARWSSAIVDEYPDFSIVGEEWSRNPLVVSYWQAGPGRRGQAGATRSMMDFPLHYALLESLQQPEGFESGLRSLYQALVNDRLYADPARLVLFDGNHDTPRIYTRLGEDASRWRAAMVYLLTMPRTPQIFYGSEILLTSPLQRDDGRVRADFPGGWPGDRSDAFRGQGLAPAQLQAQRWLRQLLRWRQHKSVVHEGALTHFLPDDGLYVWIRHQPGQQVLAAINRSDRPRRLDPQRYDEVLQGRREGTELWQGRIDLEHAELPAGASWVIDLDAAGNPAGRPESGQP